MAPITNAEGSITILVHLKIKPEHNARALELWHEQIAAIEATEPPGNVKYSLFRNNSVEHEYTVMQTCAHPLLVLIRVKLILSRFASKEIMEAWQKSPKHVEISSKVYGEEIIDGEPDARYCIRVAGTSN
jgi:quinol monooxygenase YgiN